MGGRRDESEGSSSEEDIYLGGRVISPLAEQRSNRSLFYGDAHQLKSSESAPQKPKIPRVRSHHSAQSDRSKRSGKKGERQRKAKSPRMMADSDIEMGKHKRQSTADSRKLRLATRSTDTALSVNTREIARMRRSRPIIPYTIFFLSIISIIFIFNGDDFRYTEIKYNPWIGPVIGVYIQFGAMSSDLVWKDSGFWRMFASFFLTPGILYLAVDWLILFQICNDLESEFSSRYVVPTLVISSFAGSMIAATYTVYITTLQPVFATSILGMAVADLVLNFKDIPKRKTRLFKVSAGVLWKLLTLSFPLVDGNALVTAFLMSLTAGLWVCDVRKEDDDEGPLSPRLRSWKETTASLFTRRIGRICIGIAALQFALVLALFASRDAFQIQETMPQPIVDFFGCSNILGNDLYDCNVPCTVAERDANGTLVNPEEIPCTIAIAEGRITTIS